MTDWRASACTQGSLYFSSSTAAKRSEAERAQICGMEEEAEEFFKDSFDEPLKIPG
jgi:hypothetical protein